jgi:hypothetical protein
VVKSLKNVILEILEILEMAKGQKKWRGWSWDEHKANKCEIVKNVKEAYDVKQMERSGRFKVWGTEKGWRMGGASEGT